MTIFKIFKRDFPKVLKNRHSCLLLSGTQLKFRFVLCNSTLLWTLVTLLCCQAEDDQERFDRMQKALLMANPESVAFYNAQMRTHRRVGHTRCRPILIRDGSRPRGLALRSRPGLDDYITAMFSVA